VLANRDALPIQMFSLRLPIFLRVRIVKCGPFSQTFFEAQAGCQPSLPTMIMA
jgi:hypothetical protein